MGAVRMTQNNSVAGFTLIELMITVTIVGMLASWPCLPCRQMILAQSVRSSTSDLQTALYFTRSEAIKRAVNVAITPVSADWKNGWTVTVGADGTANSTMR